MQVSQSTRAAAILAALGSEHRLRIVELLGRGERCVCEITPEFDLDPSVVSRHLAVLEQAGVITSRRLARWIFYRIADRRIPELVELALRAGKGRAARRQRGTVDRPKLKE